MNQPTITETTSDPPAIDKSAMPGKTGPNVAAARQRQHRSAVSVVIVGGFVALALLTTLSGVPLGVTSTAHANPRQATPFTEEADRIAEILRLRPGMVVADVGAGAGSWSAELARRVGETGQVFATEVEAEALQTLRDGLREADLDNVTVVLGDQQSTGLPPACCDSILLRRVYHHFADPAAMHASLLRALRPGGVIAVIDFAPDAELAPVEGTPERGGHGVGPDEVLLGMTSGGFQTVGRHDDWNPEDGDFCVVLRRAPSSS